MGFHMMQGQPIIILKEGTERSKGKGAQLNNIATDTELLKEIASTAMSGRSVGTSRDFLGTIAVKAVKSILEEVAGKPVADVDNILVVKKHGGALTDTQLVDGIILDKERVHPRMPKFVRDAKIVLLNRA